MPFAVLVGAMSCYLALSRRLELVVARAAGVSAWQFVAPSMIAAFLFGVVATTIYNPLAAVLHERSKRLEAEMIGRACLLGRCSENSERLLGPPAERRRRGDHQRQDRAASKAPQLGGVSVFTFDNERAFPGADRGQERDARARATGGSTTRASTPAARPPVARGAYRLRHQPDARAGARKLRHAGDRAVLATSLLHRAGRSRRSWWPPAIACNTSSSCRGRSCLPPWSCSRPR